MVVRDVFGNYVQEKDTVTVALSPGNFLFGKIDKISSGLDGQPPMAFVTVTMPLPIHSNGVVQGVIYVKVEEEKKLVGS